MSPLLLELSTPWNTKQLTPVMSLCRVSCTAVSIYFSTNSAKHGP